jgi:hypothetical protein
MLLNVLKTLEIRAISPTFIKMPFWLIAFSLFFDVKNDKTATGVTNYNACNRFILHF